MPKFLRDTIRLHVRRAEVAEALQKVAEVLRLPYGDRVLESPEGTIPRQRPLLGPDRLPQRLAPPCAVKVDMKLHLNEVRDETVRYLPH